MGSYSKLTYHVVFSTKYRRPSITEEVRDRLYEYLGGVVRNLGGHLIEIGGVEDHVHLLLQHPPTLALSESLRELKANSSKWVTETFPSLSQFTWQVGYSAFTVNYSQIAVVQRYIQTQEEHHRTKSFQEEYMELLTRHGIAFELAHLFEGENHS